MSDLLALAARRVLLLDMATTWCNSSGSRFCVVTLLFLLEYRDSALVPWGYWWCIWMFLVFFSDVSWMFLVFFFGWCWWCSMSPGGKLECTCEISECRTVRCEVSLFLGVFVRFLVRCYDFFC